MNALTTSLLAGTALSAAVLAAPLSSAATAPVPAAPSGMTQAASTSAASAAHGSLGQAFTTSTAERQGKNPKALDGGETKAVGAPVAVYTLNPQFVKSGTGPVGTFAYAASAYSINGTTATVDSIRQGDTWQAANIATGQDEQSYAKQAKGSPLLYEPQVHAWYAVKGSKLTALNTSAKKAIGGSTISVADYAKQVHAKYAAFLPGSAYDEQGKAGGFKDAPAQGLSTHHGDSSVRDGSLAATAGVVLVGAGAAFRRRRQS